MIRSARASLAAAATLALLLAACASQAPAGTPPPSPTDPPGSPTDVPSDAPSPTTPQPAPPTAPNEWTEVHTVGDGTARIMGGEIAWGDAGFVAVSRELEFGEGGTHIAGYALVRSADGQAWTDLAFPTPPGGGQYSVSTLTGAGDGSYVLHAIHQTETSLPRVVSLRSTDGEAWESIDTGLPADLNIVAIEEGPAGYLLVAGQGHQTNPTLWLSADALTWEPVHEFEQATHYVQIHDGDGGAGGYVVIGRRIEPDGGTYERFALASANGRDWVEQREPFGPDDQTFVWEVGVTSHGDGWLATLGLRAESTGLWTSPDGLTWTESGSLAAINTNAATSGLVTELGDELILAPGAAVAFDGSPGAFTSTDGVSWSPLDFGTNVWLGDVAVGDGIVAMTGTDTGAGDQFVSIGLVWIRALE